MSGPAGMVSVIMPFLNAEEFIEESILSVFAQSYEHWELLLIDDGSRDGSTRMAREHAARRPEKVRYLEHPGHQNFGQSGSRNLGCDCARGNYIATLDADDLFYPNQLEDQMHLLEAHPSAGMVFGSTLFWYSWTGNPADQIDWAPDLGVPDNTLFQPPVLATRFLRRQSTPPQVCGVLARREAVQKTGGFELSFPYFNVFLYYPALATNRCWGKYRKHASSISERRKPALLEVQQWQALEALAERLSRDEIRDTDLRKALSDAIWPYHHPFLHEALAYLQPVANRMAQWFWKTSRRIGGRAAGGIVARPNPLRIADEASNGLTTLSWSASRACIVEVRLDAPDGTLFSRTPPAGSKQTGPWVTDGMTFFLQDPVGPGGLTAENTLASVSVRVVGPRRKELEFLATRVRNQERGDDSFDDRGLHDSSDARQLRNQAMAEWIMETHPRRVIECAATGPELAVLLESAFREYVWSPLDPRMADQARKVFRKAAVCRIDLINRSGSVPWGRYEAVVCSAPGRLPNDLVVISEISPATNVFLCSSTSEGYGQAGVPPTEQLLRGRFEHLLEIVRIKTVADQIIVHGVRKDRRYTDPELRRMFFSKQRIHFERQPRMHKFVARNLYGRVLEVGCWNGFLYPYLRCGHYTGTDMCEEAIAEARRQYPGEFLVSDWSDVPQAGPFDSIYFNDVMGYQADPTATVKKFEICKPCRIVVQTMQEVRLELPYRLRSAKAFHFDGREPKRFRRRVVRIYDL